MLHHWFPNHTFSYQWEISISLQRCVKWSFPSWWYRWEASDKNKAVCTKQIWIRNHCIKSTDKKEQMNYYRFSILQMWKEETRSKEETQWFLRLFNLCDLFAVQLGFASTDWYQSCPIQYVCSMSIGCIYFPLFCYYKLKFQSNRSNFLIATVFYNENNKI